MKALWELLVLILMIKSITPFPAPKQNNHFESNENDRQELLSFEHLESPKNNGITEVHNSPFNLDLMPNYRYEISNGNSDADDQLNDTTHNTTSTVKSIGGKTIITNETIISRKTKTGNILWTIRAVETRNDVESNQENDLTTTVAVPTISTDTTEFMQISNAEMANFPKDVEYYSSEEFDPSHRNQDFFEDIDGLETFEFQNNDNHEHQQEHKFINKLEDFVLPLPSLLPSSSESLSNDHHPSTEYKLFHSSFNNDNENDSDNGSNGYGDDNQNYDAVHPIEFGHHNNDDIVDNNMDGRFPVDLSNDIAINQMLLDQGASFHPDAEIFSIDEHDQQKQIEQRPISFTDIK